MRLGLFGGTFDPIHYGHLVLAEQCREHCRLEKVWFIPAGQPPHKPARTITPAHHRVEMVQLAIAGHPAFEVCTREIDRPGPSYTVDTLQDLQDEDPSRELFFLIGSDSLRELPSWREPHRILRLAQLVVARRADSEVPSLEGLAPLVNGSQLEAIRRHLVEISHVGISSTECRRRIARGQSIRYLVPRAVECYIQTHKLYEADEPLSGPGWESGDPRH